MRDGLLLFVAGVFTLAGFVKGVIGLGLPTISMGLLALVMPPVQAAAFLVVPSLLTNAWQMWRGPSLAAVTVRLWPMMLAVCAGTWVASGLMTGSYASAATAILGLTLALYAASGLLAVRLEVPGRHEWWLGVAAGAVTGIVTAATGVFVIPAVPYLQAIGLEKDHLVQALGLSFTVSTLALAANIVRAGGSTSPFSERPLSRWRLPSAACGLASIFGPASSRWCSAAASSSAFWRSAFT